MLLYQTIFHLDKCKSVAYSVIMNRKITHDCHEELRVVELKATPARLAVLKFLESSNSPVDVSAINMYLSNKKIPADPATVFRIINKFTDKGLTRPIQLHEGKFRYELANGTDHHHLICESCGSIEDMSDCNVDTLEKEIRNKKDFIVKNHSLEFFGVCHACSLLEDSDWRAGKSCQY